MKAPKLGKKRLVLVILVGLVVVYNLTFWTSVVVGHQSYSQFDDNYYFRYFPERPDWFQRFLFYVYYPAFRFYRLVGFDIHYVIPHKSLRQ